MSRNGLPALLAVTLLVLAEALRFFKGLLPFWGNIEVISNALMLGIAIFFSARERLFEREESSSSRRVAWIISIPLIAACMNVDVFGHAIRLEHLLPDLWGYHAFWIACAVLQLLILTPLGEELLEQIRLLWEQLIGILSWGRDTVVRLGSIFSSLLDQILALIEQSSEKMIFIIILGFFLWACWLSTQVPGQDISVLLANVSFLGKNLLVWIYYLLITLLVCLLPSAVKKTKDGLLGLDAKHVIAAVAAISLLAVSAFLLPFLAGIAVAMLLLAGALIAFLKWTLKKDRMKFDLTGSSHEPLEGSGSGEGGAPPSSTKTSIRMGDLSILLILFMVIPLFFVFILALPTTAGQELISKGPSDFTAWIDFGKSALDLISALVSFPA